MNSNDLEVGAFFTTNGKDIWRLMSYFNEPSCTLENVDDSARRETFGIRGLTAQSFHRIKMPEIVQVGEPPVLVNIGKRQNG